MSGFISAVLAASGVLMFALGAYVLARNPYQDAARSFFVLTAGLGLLCYLQMLIDQTWEGAVADLTVRIYAFAFLLTEGTFLILSRSICAPRDDLIEVRGRLSVMVLMVALSLVFALAIDGVVPREPGFGLRWGPGTLAFGLAFAALAVMATVKMLTVRETSSDRGFRAQTLVLAVGSLLPALVVASMLAGGWGGLEGLTALGFLSTGAALGYLATASTLFQLPEVKGPSLVSGRRVRPISQPGSTILFEGKGSEPAFETLIEELPFGEKGLIITRQHPDQVRDRFAVGGTRMLWLCGQPGEGRVDPQSLTILQNLMLEHIQKHGRSLILLDGVEYLVSENRVDKVLRLIYAVRDAVVVSGSKLLVPVDPDTLDPKELALIEREFSMRVPGPGRP